MKTFGTHAFVNPMLAAVLVAIGFGGSVGLGTVWMRHQISVVADTNRDLEQQIREVERQITDVNAAIEQATSLEVLRAKNVSMNLGLVEMTQGQIVSAAEDVVDPLQQFVAHANRRVLERDAAAGGMSIRLNFDEPGAATAATVPARPASTAAPATTPSAAPRAPFTTPLQLAVAR